MTTDTTKITGAADDLSDKLTKGGGAAKTLGAEIANAFAAQDARITALEAGSVTEPPPIEPPPSGGSGPTGGKVTNFTSAPKQDLKIDNVGHCVTTAGKPYSLANPDPYTLRYEMRQGDRAWFDSSTGLDRCQVECRAKVQNDQPFWIECRVMIEPGPENTAEWLIFFEHHNSDGELPSGGSTSPPLHLELPGQDKFQFTILYCRPGENPPSSWKKTVIWTQPNKFERGRWYVFRIEAKMNQTNGYARMWLDGQQVANYSGPVGFGCSTYWMMGPYRQTRPEPFAINIKNFTASWAAA